MKELRLLLENSGDQVEAWIENKYRNLNKPLFSSVDIRDAGFKVTHVDTNLFPSGFNNLSQKALNKGASLLKNSIQKNYTASKIALVPENFTNNIKYFNNLHALQEMLVTAGFEVVIGSPYIAEIMHITDLQIVPLFKQNKVVVTEDNWQPDLIILNNDLTLGIPEALRDINQPIVPSPFLGWYKRRKYNHFVAYNKLIDELAKVLGFDPWLLTTVFDYSTEIDFRNKQGLEELAEKVENIIRAVKEKYLEYKIKREPFVYIKSAQGTYGMGVLVVKSGLEIIKINKKHRHSMQNIKHGIKNSEVIIQEGIPTIESVDGMSAESLAYFISSELIQMLVRFNPSKDNISNLNSIGMQIKRQEDYPKILEIIAKIATLASALEMN